MFSWCTSWLGMSKSASLTCLASWQGQLLGKGSCGSLLEHPCVTGMITAGELDFLHGSSGLQEQGFQGSRQTLHGLLQLSLGNHLTSFLLMLLVKAVTSSPGVEEKGHKPILLNGSSVKEFATLF